MNGQVITGQLAVSIVFAKIITRAMAPLFAHSATFGSVKDHSTRGKTMKNWLNQRTTWLGIGSALVAVLGVLAVNGTIDPVWSTAAAAGLSALGLRINDKR